MIPPAKSRTPNNPARPQLVHWGSFAAPIQASGCAAGRAGLGRGCILENPEGSGDANYLCQSSCLTTCQFNQIREDETNGDIWIWSTILSNTAGLLFQEQTDVPGSLFMGLVGLLLAADSLCSRRCSRS